MTGILLGLGGFAASGKDTVADHLEIAYDSWKKLYMSAPLEKALLKVNPWVYVSPNNWENRHVPSEVAGGEAYMRYSVLHSLVGYDWSKRCQDVRSYLQRLGTEVGRHMFGENVWVDYAFSEVDRLRSEGVNVALTGMRFPNELTALRSRGGVGVWVDRPGYGPVNAHASDNTLGSEDFDICVHNVGTLVELYDAVRIVVEALELQPKGVRREFDRSRDTRNAVSR